MQYKLRLYLCLLALILACSDIKGQETFKDNVPITLAKADSIFLAKNLLLLAERFNVDASRAQIIQARLFNNITFNLFQNVYNPENNKWFYIAEDGETAASIQKLFLLAGKRNKRITLADLSYKKEEQHYFDMMRTLKYSLRSDFYSIYYLKQIITMYDNETTNLSKLITAFENQLAAGFVSRKEVLRLKSSLFSLESEKQGYVIQLISNLSDFNILLHTSNVDYTPQLDLQKPAFKPLDLFRLQPLIDTAIDYRYDLLMAQSDVAISQANLKYQKAIGVPDLTLGAGWDRNGSFVHNYNYVSMQIDLPISNRNQGNIKSAALAVESSKTILEEALDKVKSDVIQAFSTALTFDKLYHKFDENFVNELQTQNEEMIKNYEKRNISTLEFLDYYDAYKNNMIQLNNLKNSRANAFENLNFSVGKDITNN
jgi:cobalt-zinc-cadmium efflux system outer membrane protein